MRTSSLSIVGTVSLSVLAGCGNTDFKMMGGAAGTSVATDDAGHTSTARHDAGPMGSQASSREAGSVETSVTSHSSSSSPDASAASSPDASAASSPDASQTPDASGAPDASADAGIDAPVAPPPCDGTQPPSAASCVLSETYGVFVAPSASGGSDTTGTGTRTKPYATITNALSNLGALSRIYVCNGAYTDQVTVSGSVGIFGGMTCGGSASGGTSGPWQYAGGTSASVTGSSPAFALEIAAGSAAVDVEDMTFNAAPGAAFLPSSVAAFVISSSAVVLRRTTLLAAAGYPGVNGAAGVPTSPTGVTGPAEKAPLDGHPASATVGGAAKQCDCGPVQITVGGAGGTNGAVTSQAGQPVQTMPSPASATGAGQNDAECIPALLAGENGVNGSNAVPVAAADGAGANLGTLDEMGWHPGSGAAGVDGSPGQGGGGGGAFLSPGGGGACGGCGGSGGGFGTGGGGSIALLAIDSPVQIVAGNLTSGIGGPGGSGAPGGAGEPGGTGGAASGSGTCAGGDGGNGSMGGAGGGGAGGVSFAILYQGAAPLPDLASVLTVGSGGVGGVGGDPGEHNDGPKGYAFAMLDVSLF